eukprot:249189_1
MASAMMKFASEYIRVTGQNGSECMATIQRHWATVEEIIHGHWGVVTVANVAALGESGWPEQSNLPQDRYPESLVILSTGLDRSTSKFIDSFLSILGSLLSEPTQIDQSLDQQPSPGRLDNYDFLEWISGCGCLSELNGLIERWAVFASKFPKLTLQAHRAFQRKHSRCHILCARSLLFLNSTNSKLIEYQEAMRDDEPSSEMSIRSSQTETTDQMMDDSTPSPMSTSTSPSNSDFLMSSSEEHLNGSAANAMRHSVGCWLIHMLPGECSKLKRRILKDIIFDENILRNLYESDNLPSGVSSLEKVCATLCDIYDDSIQVDPGFVISDWLLSPFENINATLTQTNDSPTKLSRVKALLSLICILSKVGVTHEYFASLPAGLVLRSVMTVYLCGS